jgi:hypothetical protein
MQSRSFNQRLRLRHTATTTGWAQNIALGLQVLLGALTTALGAALSGKNVRDITLPYPILSPNINARHPLRSRSSAARRHS